MFSAPTQQCCSLLKSPTWDAVGKEVVKVLALGCQQHCIHRARPWVRRPPHPTISIPSVYLMWGTVRTAVS